MKKGWCVVGRIGDEEIERTRTWRRLSTAKETLDSLRVVRPDTEWEIERVRTR